MKPVQHMAPWVCFFCMLAWPLAGLADASPKFAVIDLDRLMSTSNAGKKLLAPMNEVIHAGQAEAERLDGEIQKIRDQAIEHTKNPIPGSHQALLLLQAQFSRHLAELTRLDVDTRQKLTRMRYQSLLDFNHAALPVIQALGKELGLSLILRKQESGLLYADEASDLTSLAIQRLDAPPAK